MAAIPYARRVRRSRRHRSPVVPIAAGAALVVAGIVAVVLLARPDTGGLALTGATNAMGMPVVTTPGSASGEASAGDEPVQLGEPHAEVLEGCCPGPLTLEQRTVAPGAATTLTFDLAMHEGMDGWHDMAVHVPVEDTEAPLTVRVTGDFRD